MGVVIVFRALFKGMLEHHEKLAAQHAIPETFSPASEVQHLSPTGRIERVMLVTDGSEFSQSAASEAISLAKRCKSKLFAFSVLATPEFDGLGDTTHTDEKKAVVQRPLKVCEQASAVGVEYEILLGHGMDPYIEIVDQGEASKMEVIVMGRRDKSDLMRSILGSTRRLSGTPTVIYWWCHVIPAWKINASFCQ